MTFFSDGTIQFEENEYGTDELDNMEAGLSVATSGGFGSASIFLPKLIKWIRENKPEFLEDQE